MSLPIDFPVLTRDEAHALGKKKYWNGTPCRRGHRAMRFVVSGNCTACASMSGKRYSADSRRSVLSGQQTREGFRLTDIWVHPNDMPALLMVLDSLCFARGAIVGPDGHALIEPVS